ncbi:MAG: hypothetical protein JG770_1632 [Mahella sp.]|nr:hypothetical protein [Mahella sp.]
MYGLYDKIIDVKKKLSTSHLSAGAKRLFIECKRYIKWVVYTRFYFCLLLSKRIAPA